MPEWLLADEMQPAGTAGKTGAGRQVFLPLLLQTEKQVYNQWLQKINAQQIFHWKVC